MMNMVQELESLFDMPEGCPCPSSPSDGSSGNLAEALFQAASWNAKADIYLAFINRVCGDGEPPNPVFVEYAGRGIEALAQTIEALHGISDELMIIPNIVGVTYM